jgi:WD40 repeat protein
VGGETAASPRVDWVGALDVSHFSGREVEVAELSEWIVQEHCRLVSVLGMGGIGKSMLASLLGSRLTPHFEAVLWRSVRDARLLASSDRDHLIWLWDVERGRYRAALSGHEAGVYAIAFTPDSRHLLSSSDDGTLRLWQVERGQCVQVLQSYAISLYGIAWSPDGTKIASAGTDTLVTIWDGGEGGSLSRPRVLRGHSWVVHGVTWSPDGKMVASSGWDSTVRIRDTSTGTEIRILQDPDHVDALIFGLA